MILTPAQLLERIAATPDTIAFADVQATIDAHYRYSPTRFVNGSGGDPVVNPAGTNEGSCRLFAFARLNRLSEAATLACFGHFYRDEVLGDPNGTNHANIRRFMRDGWAGVTFDGEPLQPL